MLLFSIAFSAMLSGYDAYVNACTSQGDSKMVCKCQADFLALKLTDDEILQLTVAGSNAEHGRNDKVQQIIQHNPKIIVAVEKLEKQSVACGQEFN